ncbi:hypothetical protein BH11PSE7_BH11PSE7_15180 [soil metagenome]
MANNGPLYGRLVEGRLQLGFRVEERHSNPRGVCHGGMLASFADMLMPCAVLYQDEASLRRFYPTISLDVDYLAAAPLGAWVQGEAQLLRGTRNLMFAHGLVHADDAVALRVSGVFKQGPLIGDGGDVDPFRLRSATLG